MDITETITAYINRLRARGFAENTVGSYARNLVQFRRYLASQNIVDIRQVTRRLALAYQDTVMAQIVTTETKAIKLRVVRRLFDDLVESEKLLINPTEGLFRLRRRTRKYGVVLTDEEFRRLCSQPDMKKKLHIRNRVIIELMYSTGIRANELVNLKLADIDTGEAVLFIRHGKGGRDRVVPLNKSVISYLTLYLKEVRPWYTKRRPQEERLFISRSGRLLETGAIRVFLREYRVKAGIQKSVSPHTLRRTCATHFLMQGADIRYVQELLGHKRLSTTQAYTRLAPIDIKRMHDNTHPGKTIETPNRLTATLNKTE